MHEFGSTGITTGYLKQLLASTEIPTIRIYTREMQKYFDNHLVESPFVLESYSDTLEGMLPVDPATLAGFRSIESGVAQVQPKQEYRNIYIKDGLFQMYRGGYYDTNASYVPGLWQSTTITPSVIGGGTSYVFSRGERIPNVTKHLQLKNNIYDSYTHEYLGDYLRFIRDYDGLDLMPLYNCFSNRVCASRAGLNIELKHDHALSGKIKLDAGDANYKIYCLPVKLFNKYTIAIDSPAPIEICCGLYSTELATDSVAEQLITDTYCCKTYSSFGKPFLFTALQDIAASSLPKYPKQRDIDRHRAARQFIANLSIREKDLKMFIKVPKEIDSSIVVLEGDYTTWNDQVLVKNRSAAYTDSNKYTLKVNHTVVSNEAIYYDADLSLCTPLQLLRLNTKKQVPFADRLLEYLLDQCITGGDNDPREDILSVQYLAKHHFKDTTQDLPIYYGVDIEANTDLSETDNILRLTKNLQSLLNKKQFFKTTTLTVPTKLTFKKNYPVYFFVPDTYGTPDIDQLVQTYTSKIISESKRIDTPWKTRYHKLQPADIELSLAGSTDIKLDVLIENSIVKVPYHFYKLDLGLLVRSVDNVKSNSNLIIKEDYLPSFVVSFEQTAVPLKISYNLVNGVWTESLRKLLYRYMQTNFSGTYTYVDSLGYVDKNVEKEFTAVIPKPTGKAVRKTLLNINVWEDINDE